jgi:hypothetical protein
MIKKIESFEIPGHSITVLGDNKEYMVVYNHYLVLKNKLEEALSLYNATIKMALGFQRLEEEDLNLCSPCKHYQEGYCQVNKGPCSGEECKEEGRDQ